MERATEPYREPDAGADLVHLVDDLERALDAAALTSTPRLARSAVPRGLLAPATRGRLLRMALEEWAMLGAIWTAMAWAPWWLYPALALLAAGRFYALGVLMHDCAHMPLRGKDLRVRLLEILCAYPMATTLEAMRYHHTRHHRDSGMASDPYFKASLDGRPWLYALNVLRGLALVPFWVLRVPVGLVSVIASRARNVYGRVWLQDRSGQDLTGSRELVQCGRAELGQGIAQALVIAAAIAWPAAVLLGYLVPITIAGVLLAWRLLREHNYVPARDRRVETILATTNDHCLGWAGALVLAPRNIGYHVVHHIHPQVSLEALPALRRWYLEHHADVYPKAR
jgi:fatty acid desaturase